MKMPNECHFHKKVAALVNYFTAFWYIPNYLLFVRILLSQGFPRLVYTKKWSMYEHMFKNYAISFLYSLKRLHEKIFSFFHVVACRNFFTIFRHFFERPSIHCHSRGETPFHKVKKSISATGWHFFGIFDVALDNFARIKPSSPVIIAFLDFKN